MKARYYRGRWPARRVDQGTQNVRAGESTASTEAGEFHNLCQGDGKHASGYKLLRTSMRSLEDWNRGEARQQYTPLTSSHNHVHRESRVLLFLVVSIAGSDGGRGP